MLRYARWFVLFAVLLTAAGCGTSTVGTEMPPSTPPSLEFAAATGPVIVYAVDGMQHGRVERYVAQEAMFTLQTLMEEGVRADPGPRPPFPPTSAVGLATLLTGAWPAEHGMVNSVFYQVGGGDFDEAASAGGALLQADTLAQAAERAGKTVVAFEWPGMSHLDPPLNGVVVESHTDFTLSGVVVNYDLLGQPAGAEAFEVSYQRVDLEPADGWVGAPDSFSPAQQTRFTMPGLSGNASYTFDVYVYDSTDDQTVNYDRVRIVPDAAGKDASQVVADTSQGGWANVKVQLTGEREGQTAGFHIRPVEIAPDLSRFRLYYTPVTRANVVYRGCDYEPGCGTPLGLEERINADLPSAAAPDRAALAAGLIDEETYVQQGLLLWRQSYFTHLGQIVATLDDPPDLLLLGNPLVDEYSHYFLPLITPTDLDGNPNPYYDDATGDGVADGLVEEREEYLRSIYDLADGVLMHVQRIFNFDTTLFVVSGYGTAPQWYAVNASRVLADAGLQEDEQAGNCRLPADGAAQVKVCWAGAAAHIYVYLAGRDVGGTVPAEDYEAVRAKVIAAFQNLTDPAHPDRQVVAEVFKKEELEDVDGTNALCPDRSGDVVVLLRPPYHFDAPTPGTRIAFSAFLGEGGFPPGFDGQAEEADLYGVFVAAGEGIAHGEMTEEVELTDLAPTVTHLLGIPAPQDSLGEVLYSILE